MIQRNRELITGQLTLDYFVGKAAEGWKMAAIEWVREVEADTPEEVFRVSFDAQNIPYGLRISEDGMHLEPHPLERTVLLLILEKIIKEKRVTEIAVELNAEGMKARGGTDWTASAVFELLPRLVEMGPALLKSQDWRERRARISPPN